MTPADGCRHGDPGSGGTALTVDTDALRAGLGVKWGAVEADVLPAWVADMDFGIPPVVAQQLAEQLRRGDLGYPYFPDGDPVALAFEARMTDRYGWTPAPGRTRLFSDLIQTLQVVIEQTTRPGEGVAVHVPTYPPFLASIQRAGRRVVPLPVPLEGERWQPATDVGRILRETGCRLLVVVNPHNPTGRVLDRTELEALAESALAAGVAVFADEIHAELIHDDRRHIPFASLSPQIAARTITATSATKTFNLAGIRCAVAHIGDGGVADRLDRMPLDYFGTPSTLGRVATLTAWEDGADWRRAVLDRLHRNRALVDRWVREAGLGITGLPPEATYLYWLDLGSTPVADAPAELLELRARVRLSGGTEFAQHTDVDTGRFARLNFATSEDILTEIINRIDRALRVA